MNTPQNVRTFFDNLINKDVRTESILAELKLPQRFCKLAPDQQRDVIRLLQQIPPDLQRLVMYEWNWRCEHEGVRYPAGYLFGILKKAIKGEFRGHACLKAHKSPQTQPVKHKPPESQNTGPEHNVLPPEEAQVYIDQIRKKLAKPSIVKQRR